MKLVITMNEEDGVFWATYDLGDGVVVRGDDCNNEENAKNSLLAELMPSAPDNASGIGEL